MISRVYANSERDDEFVEIANPGGSFVDLTNWSLSDGEGDARFPSGTMLAPGTVVTATGNATRYAEDLLISPDFTWRVGDAPILSGSGLRLANAGDEVLLLDANRDIVDAFVYGGSAYAGPGWVGASAPAPGRGEVSVRIRTSQGFADTDTAADWDATRKHRLGQSDFHPQALNLTARPVSFVSPEDGARPLLSFLASATRTIEVAVYTLTSDAVAAILAERQDSGVRVRVLLEGAPVGGIDDREAWIVPGLVNAGIEVRWLASGSDVVKRYRYLHAKYALVDGAAAFITSENFGEAGFPLDGPPGNRGWSVILPDLRIAGQLWEVFEEDFDPRRRDSVPAAGDGVTVLGPPPAVPRWVPRTDECCTAARLIIGPDNALDRDRILGLLASARERIWIEAFYAEDPWPSGPSPFLAAAFDAARRGVSVRILLDQSPWTSTDPESGNEALVTALLERARAAGLDMDARLHPDVASIERIHNKGVIVDGRAVLVSSLNWAYVSATQDREIGVIFEDSESAARFEASFAADWDGRDLRPMTFGPRANPTETVAAYAIVIAVSLLSLWKLRQGDKGTSGRGPMKRRGGARPPLRRGRGEVRLLPPELVAESRPRARRGRIDRRRGEEARDRLEGPEGGRGPGGDRQGGRGRRHVLRDRGHDHRDRRGDVRPRLRN